MSLMLFIFAVWWVRAGDEVLLDTKPMWSCWIFVPINHLHIAPTRALWQHRELVWNSALIESTALPTFMHLSGFMWLNQWFLNVSTVRLHLIVKYLGGKKFHRPICYNCTTLEFTNVF